MLHTWTSRLTFTPWAGTLSGSFYMKSESPQISAFSRTSTTTTPARWMQRVSVPFLTTSWVWQGCHWTSLTSMIYWMNSMMECHPNLGIEYYFNFSNFCYADNFMLFPMLLDTLLESLKPIIEEAFPLVLTISWARTKFQFLSERHHMGLLLCKWYWPLHIIKGNKMGTGTYKWRIYIAKKLNLGRIWMFPPDNDLIYTVKIT